MKFSIAFNVLLLSAMRFVAAAPVESQKAQEITKRDPPMAHIIGGWQENDQSRWRVAFANTTCRHIGALQSAIWSIDLGANFQCWDATQDPAIKSWVFDVSGYHGNEGDKNMAYLMRCITGAPYTMGDFHTDECMTYHF